MSERTFVLCKPDAVERGLVGRIIGYFEAENLKISEAKVIHIDKDLAGRHYGEHEGKPFYESLVSFITRSPSMAFILEGEEGTIALVRKIMGATDPSAADPGTIRGDLAQEVTENLVHGSDSLESAIREMDLFFGS